MWNTVFFVFFLLIFLNFYWYSITVVCLFAPSLHPTPAEPTSFPYLHPPPWFCPCVLYSSSCKSLSPLDPPHSRLAIVRFILTSTSLVIFCLLFPSIDYVPVCWVSRKACSFVQQEHIWGRGMGIKWWKDRLGTTVTSKTLETSFWSHWWAKGEFYVGKCYSGNSVKRKKRDS